MNFPLYLNYNGIILKWASVSHANHHCYPTTWDHENWPLGCLPWHWYIHIYTQVPLSENPIYIYIIYICKCKCMCMYVCMYVYIYIYYTYIYTYIMTILNTEYFSGAICFLLFTWYSFYGISKCSMFVQLYATVMNQCVSGNLMPIMLWIIYFSSGAM